MPISFSSPIARFAVAAALVAPAAACGGARGRRAPAVAPATLAFVNQSLQQSTLYAIGQAGEWYRLGVAAPGQTARFRLPSTLVASGQTFNLVSRPLATSRLATSGPITARPGDTYTVTLPVTQNLLGVLPGLPEGMRP